MNTITIMRALWLWLLFYLWLWFLLWWSSLLWPQRLLPSAEVVMLCVSAVPSIALAFLCGSWQGSGSMLAFLSGDQAAKCLKSSTL